MREKGKKKRERGFCLLLLLLAASRKKKLTVRGPRGLGLVELLVEGPVRSQALGRAVVGGAAVAAAAPQADDTLLLLFFFRGSKEEKKKKKVVRRSRLRFFCFQGCEPNECPLPSSSPNSRNMLFALQTLFLSPSERARRLFAACRKRKETSLLGLERGKRTNESCVLKFLMPSKKKKSIPERNQSISLSLT